MDVESWLEKLSDISSSCPEEALSTNPTGLAAPAGRNKRRLSMSVSRQPSPFKRRRTDDDGAAQGVIPLSSEISLSDRTKLRSSASTSSRHGSPTRDIFNQLRLADPPILCEPQATGSVPDTVLSLRRLTDGFGQNIIPRRLEVLVPLLPPGDFLLGCSLEYGHLIWLARKKYQKRPFSRLKICQRLPLVHFGLK